MAARQPQHFNIGLFLLTADDNEDEDSEEVVGPEWRSLTNKD